MRFLTLVVLAAVYGSASAHPTLDTRETSVTLPVVGKLDLSRLAGVVDADRARAAYLKSHTWGVHRKTNKRQALSVPATNTAVDFVMPMRVGEPATEYTLLLDSGSSVTWVDGSKGYNATKTSKKTGKSVGVTYGSGSFSGSLYTDKVDFGNGLVIDAQSLGVANKTSGFDGTFDGILGVGPVELTEGAVQGSSETIPTVLDNLFADKTIGVNALGMSFPPYGQEEAGSITFGGADSSHYTGELNYVPVTKADPASAYYGIDQSISYGSTSITAGTAGIVDSGTTLVLLATGLFEKYKAATNATLDSKTGLLKLPKDSYATLQPLDFNIGGKTYSLNGNAQTFPRSLNSALGGDNDSIYLIVGDLGMKGDGGFDFINGYAFMERFYTVFDNTNDRVGLASTKYTDAETN